MTRVKRGTIAIKRRKSVLKRAKGFRFGRGTKEKLAKEALRHAGKYSFAHRKDKKADARTLWQIKLNGALREQGLSYSKFMGLLKKAGIALDRKVLASLAENRPQTFAKIVDSVK